MEPEQFYYWLVGYLKALENSFTEGIDCDLYENGLTGKELKIIKDELDRIFIIKNY